MAFDINKENELIERFSLSPNDTGSTQVQCIKLSARIAKLTEHAQTHKKDFHSIRGLLKMVGKRRRFLNHLKSENLELYNDLRSSLGLRK